jgi:hypothetical protein
MKTHVLPRPHNYILVLMPIAYVECEDLLISTYVYTNLCILETICIFEHRDNYGPGANMLLHFHNLQYK